MAPEEEGLRLQLPRDGHGSLDNERWERADIGIDEHRPVHTDDMLKTSAISTCFDKRPYQRKIKVSISR